MYDGGGGGGQDYAQVGMQSSWAKCLAGCSKEAQREVRELIASSASAEGNEYLQELTEEITLSAPVTKINAKGKRQKRVLVLTNLAVYNFMPGKFRKFKRRIRLSMLSKLFVPRGEGSEFVLHSARGCKPDHPALIDGASERTHAPRGAKLISS